MIILSAPLLFSSVFYYRKNDGVDVRHRMHSLALSLIFPGAIYYLGVFAEEQFSLIVSLLCFMYWKRKLLILFLIAIVLLLDFGSGLVVASFFSMALFYTFVNKRLGFGNACLIMLIQVVCCYAIGFSILEYTKSISFLANKSEAILLALESKVLIDKYPLVLRPIITFMSFVFYTPAFLKVPVVYVIVGIACLFSLFKTYMKRGSISGNDFLESLLLSVISISFIVSFVFLFPSYANAKYYIFLLPFVICPLLYIYDNYLLLLFFVTLNIFVFLHVIYFSI
ncbi:hypothetical protein TW81_05005 [Vibrio galatheae]|uniref:Uncharacterized protein n=2 Tax=Vibrio galatheae TaxID=579748 RepID=A0A0F4NMS4_9VIBR|nr:hypothetical protein TW81_05005 [Vibrio galatheae]